MLFRSDNNYSYFLKGVELTGFRPYLQGKGILTVMAPNDEAFKTYLEKNYGTVDLTTIPKEELSKLIGFHLLYYSYNKANMENFRPEGQGATNEGSEILDPGMYYKFRTRSSSTPTQKIDPNTQKEITVYHLERFIPVFSHNYFKSTVSLTCTPTVHAESYFIVLIEFIIISFVTKGRAPSCIRT